MESFSNYLEVSMAYDNSARETKQEKMAREENKFGNGFVIGGVIVLIIIIALGFYYYNYAHNVAQNTNKPVAVPEVSTGAIDFSNKNSNANTTNQNKTNP